MPFFLLSPVHPIVLRFSFWRLQLTTRTPPTNHDFTRTMRTSTNRSNDRPTLRSITENTQPNSNHYANPKTINHKQHNRSSRSDHQPHPTPYVHTNTSNPHKESKTHGNPALTENTGPVNHKPQNPKTQNHKTTYNSYKDRSPHPSHPSPITEKSTTTTTHKNPKPKTVNGTPHLPFCFFPHPSDPGGAWIFRSGPRPSSKP